MTTQDLRGSGFLALLILVIFSATASAQEWGVIRYTRSPVNVRAGRSTQTLVVTTLPTGTRLLADFLGDNWFAVFPDTATVRDQELALGYVYAPLLRPDRPSANAKTRDANTISFRIMQREDFSYQRVQRMGYRVLLEVTELPSEEEIREVVQKIWSEGNRGWDEFTVWLYVPGMDTNLFAYVIAEFRQSGLIDFKVNPAALWETKWKPEPV